MINYLKKNSLKNKNIVIGNFDLIHKMHQKLFEITNNFVILTFINIPRKNHNDINNKKSKAYFLKELTNKKIYFFDVTKHNMSANDFFNKYLKNTNHIIVGSDFKFGNDFKSIAEFKNQINITTVNYNNKFSTSKIKSLLNNGEIEKANALLVKPFAIYDKVVHGKKIGRKLGFRTANFSNESNLNLLPGIYLTKTKYHHKIYKSITMYGKPKTIKKQHQNIMETHIINFDKIIYNKYIEVEFFKFIAPVKKYDSENSLIQAIDNFKKIALKTNY